MDLASRPYTEKRNFLRMQIDTPVKVFVQSEDSELTGICHDLSGGGMMIELDKTLPVGAELKVSIQAPTGITPMLQAKVRVNRVEAGPNDSCRLGMEIIEVIK